MAEDSNTTDFEELAQQVAQKIGTGIDWRLIYSQWRLESGDFTNWGTTVANNLSGMKQFKDNPAGIDATSPEGDNYQIFNDYNDFADYYARYISKYFPDAASAQNPEDFAHALKEGGYYGGDESSYVENLRAKLQDFTDYKSSGGTTYKAGEGAVNSVKAGDPKTATQNASDWKTSITKWITDTGTRVLKVLSGLVLLALGAYILFKGQPTKVINEKEE